MPVTCLFLCFLPEVNTFGIIFWHFLHQLLSNLFFLVAGLYVAFFVPAMLKLAGKKKIECNPVFKEIVQERRSVKIFSTGLHSRTALAYAVLTFATFSVGDVFFQILQALKIIE